MKLKHLVTSSPVAVLLALGLVSTSASARPVPTLQQAQQLRSKISQVQYQLNTAKTKLQSLLESVEGAAHKTTEASALIFAAAEISDDLINLCGGGAPSNQVAIKTAQVCVKLANARVKTVSAKAELTTAGFDPDVQEVVVLLEEAKDGITEGRMNVGCP